MNKLLTVLFVSGVVFGLMALVPDGRERSTAGISEEIPESAVTTLPYAHSLHVPAKGEPSDNGLTENLHREFREALDRDPVVAIELARQFVFTKELDPGFRVEILRELKILQFTHAEVSALAGDILNQAPDPALFEEALTIKYASLDNEEFDSLVSEMAEKNSAPEYQVILQDFGGSRIN